MWENLSEYFLYCFQLTLINLFICDVFAFSWCFGAEIVKNPILWPKLSPDCPLKDYDILWNYASDTSESISHQYNLFKGSSLSNLMFFCVNVQNCTFQPRTAPFFIPNCLTMTMKIFKNNQNAWYMFLSLHISCQVWLHEKFSNGLLFWYKEWYMAFSGVY